MREHASGYNPWEGLTDSSRFGVEMFWALLAQIKPMK